MVCKISYWKQLKGYITYFCNVICNTALLHPPGLSNFIYLNELGLQVTVNIQVFGRIGS